MRLRRLVAVDEGDLDEIQRHLRGHAEFKRAGHLRTPSPDGVAYIDGLADKLDRRYETDQPPQVVTHDPRGKALIELSTDEKVHIGHNGARLCDSEQGYPSLRASQVGVDHVGCPECVVKAAKMFSELSKVLE